MSNETKPTRRQDGTLVYKATNQIVKRFDEVKRITPQTTKAAEERVEQIEKEYSQQINGKIKAIDNAFLEFEKNPEAAELIEDLRRYILDLKSTAGMFGYPVISTFCELFFDIFDKNYDLRNVKVRKGIDLYINTLREIMANHVRDLSDPGSDYASKLVKEFTAMNSYLDK